MASAEMDALHALVEENDDLEITHNGSKVHCKSTGHDMPLKLATVKEYITGGKYKKTREWYTFDYSKYEPHIVPHETRKRFLYCKLTGTLLPMSPQKVEVHVKSKRYNQFLKENEEAAAKKAAAKERKREIYLKTKRKLEETEGDAEGKEKGSAKEKKKGSKFAKKKKGSKLAVEGKDGKSVAADGEAGEKQAGEKVKKGKKKPLRSLKMRRKNQVGADGEAKGAKKQKTEDKGKEGAADVASAKKPTTEE
eukprot:TRINITY_DN46188_c0_g1_i1.p1 TRINITY_DN46188_c0_g1~~TRINITY_DN46188_c0_g1_i1.p1  ORF type:complete len:277 (-),score=79.97 TRINITY_DN46188_c0_g1_i1:51-803(-)